MRRMLGTRTTASRNYNKPGSHSSVRVVIGLRNPRGLRPTFNPFLEKAYQKQENRYHQLEGKSLTSLMLSQGTFKLVVLNFPSLPSLSSSVPLKSSTLSHLPLPLHPCPFSMIACFYVARTLQTSFMTTQAQRNDSVE